MQALGSKQLRAEVADSQGNRLNLWIPISVSNTVSVRVGVWVSVIVRFALAVVLG